MHSLDMGHLLMQLPEFDEKTFDLLVTIYAKCTYNIRISVDHAAAFELVVSRLQALGLIIIQSHLRLTDESTYTLQLSVRGQQYITNTDPTILTRVFIRIRFISYATHWIQKFITIEQLPEFLIHKDPDIRKAAYAKYTGNRSGLIFSNELNSKTYSGTGIMQALLR